MKIASHIYRKLGGNRSRAGRVLAAVSRPRKALRSIFGMDAAAKDVAEGLNLDPSKHAYGLVTQTLRGWGKNYRGPKLSWMFRFFNQRTPSRPMVTHKPEPD